MKIVVFVLALLALLWLIKSARRRVPPPATKQPAPPPPSAVQQIVACAHCGVHLPSGEALPGRGGVFCTEAHRSDYEQGHPQA